MRTLAEDVIIYGAGGYFRFLSDALAAAGKRVSVVIDEYTERTSVGETSIVRLGSNRIDKSVPVFISVSGISPVIASQLRANGHESVFDFSQSARLLPTLIDSMLPSMPWFAAGRDSLLDEEEVCLLATRLEDDRSRAVLSSLCEFRRHLDSEHYLESDGQLQYFPEDVPLFDHMESLRFVDCGAFTGDTLEAVLRYSESRQLPVRSLCLFEPERKNLQALRRSVRARSSMSHDIVVIPCGVWWENTILDISDRESSSSIVAGNAPATSSAKRLPAVLDQIATVKLDDAAYGMCPNYIKMDIEGAERQAIRGAAEILRAHRPNLAICLYHEADDLWEIPKLIDEIQPGYKFYLRSHGDMGLETVLYAIA